MRIIRIVIDAAMAILFWVSLGSALFIGSAVLAMLLMGVIRV